MIGSDTFIIVALRCSDSSTPLALASAIWRGVELLQRGRGSSIDAAMTSPASTDTSLSTLMPPVAASVNSMRELAGLADDRRLLVAVEVAAAH